MRSSKRQILRSINALLAGYDLPTLTLASEASPSLLIALYESLKGARLQINDRKSRSITNKIRHTKILLRTISRDVMRMDVSSICPMKICEGDEYELLRLFEVMIAINHILHITRGQQVSYLSDLTKTSSMIDSNYTGECTPLCEDASEPSHRVLLSYGNLLDSIHNTRDVPTKVDQGSRNEPRKLLRHQCGTSLKNGVTFRTEPSNSCPYSRVQHSLVTESPSKSTVRSHLYTCRGSLLREKSEGRARKSALVMTPSTKMPLRDDRDPLSFFTDGESTLIPKTQSILESPHSKYVKARHTIALYEIRRRRTGRTYLQSPRKMPRGHQGQYLARSIASLPDSNASFYDEDL